MDGKSHYGRLLIMAGLSFMAMYMLMYAMVNVIGDVYPNWNQFYMAGLMTAPMVMIELALMSAMFHNRMLNRMIFAASAAALMVFFILIRQQTAISDREFLKSMIPHHSGAILMCERASIENPEVKRLCESIKSSQRSEIDQMKALLDKLEK